MLARALLFCFYCSIITTAPLLGGCGDEIILDNTGTACLSTTGQWPEGVQSFEAGQSVTVIVRLAECLSTSCDTDRTGSCSVEISGDQILITSQGSYIDESGPGSSCTEDCGIFDITCETGPIPEGSYSLVYGTEEISFAVPDDATGAYCVPLTM